jgi:coenzyme F420-reducing hydrogenase beta subunit
MRKLVRMDSKVCVVCGAPAAGITGYIFFADAHTRIGAPFCKQHLNNHWEYANPVFENKEALNVFQQKHPRLYSERVKDKKILFLTSKLGTAS